ncbi:hypothetical protein DRQ09_05630 [candidate division KSB1 bacterium]|nr:MAG: hypothetical protein DRQ09_05630 [candidate division KSB1 bacterium]
MVIYSGMLIRLLNLLKKRLFIGFTTGVIFILIIHRAVEYTSSDKFCNYCHVHPHVTSSWRLSTHYNNKSGVVVHCVECHLPPDGIKHYAEKVRLGIKDIWGKLFKDKSKINWEEKSKLELAVNFTYREACIRCHKNLFPLKLSKKGEEAHLYYTRKSKQIRCLNCHLYVGHYSELVVQKKPFGETKKAKKIIYTEPAKVEKFENYTEYIPGSSVKFDMIAIPGGTFTIGSPESEPYRYQDEGPQRKIKVSRFWMGKTEVTWDEYEEFYRQTSVEGKNNIRLISSYKRSSELEAITGATPPYGSPDQGWGRGKRPAITMTYYAAMVYCKWLSAVTGKKYRLPTEAEWEYACRGGTDGAYFFGGNPEKYTSKRLWNRIFKPDTSLINSYVIYAGNSGGKTHLPSEVKPNPFGLLNMSGNVREFCLDWYSPDAYSMYPENVTIVNPGGPPSGKEHVIRGGSYKSDAIDVRSAARDHTRHSAWMITDPQIPKSLWWYSDCNDVGFRVVCEYKEDKNKQNNSNKKRGK